MRTSVLIEIVEAGRDKTGHIPSASRYNKISSSWNDNSTQLTVTFTSKATQTEGGCAEQQMTLRLEDHELI